MCGAPENVCMHKFPCLPGMATPLRTNTVASDQLRLTGKSFMVSDRFSLASSITFMSLNHMGGKVLGRRSMYSSLRG